MSLHSDRYLEMVERFGGVNPEALESFVYWNNPLSLKHWTMNIVELLFIAGALASLTHAIKQFRESGNGSYLAFMLSMVIYCFVIEVPVYFPHLIGLPPDVIFIHNEFTLGFVFNQTPLYIICLYPALLYTCYIVVERLGVFARYPMIVGAICVGFVHSCLYEIFDHFGPQYNWWIWDYDNPVNALLVNGVPLFSIANFSLVPPIAMTLLARALLFNRHSGAKNSAGTLLLKSLALGVATPAVMFIIAPTTIASFFTSNAAILTWVSWLTLALAAAVTVVAFRGASNTYVEQHEHTASRWTSYPFAFVWIYLAVFIALWVYALDDYFAAVDGITSFETYIGSLAYVLGCYVFGLFFLYQLHAKQARSATYSPAPV